MDDTTLLDTLILYIISELQDRQSPCTTVRIAKFLYLADVEAMCLLGQSITGLEWIHHLYGPWASAIPVALQRLAPYFDVRQVRTAEKHTARVFRTQEHPELDLLLSFSKERIFNRVLDTWADEDEDEILNFVYFHTEPMLAALEGEVLDMSLVHRRCDDPRPMPEIPDEKARAFGERLKRTLKKLNRNRVAVPPHRDEFYYEMLRAEVEEARIPPDELGTEPTPMPPEVAHWFRNQR